MATLTIRQIDDRVYDRWKARAAENHRSLEAEVRAVLEEQAFDSREWVADMRERHRRSIAKHGLLSDSMTIIRQARDEG